MKDFRLERHETRVPVFDHDMKTSESDERRGEAERMFPMTSQTHGQT